MLMSQHFYLCFSFYAKPVSMINVTANPIALRKAKIVCNFGLSECNRVKMNGCTFSRNTFRGSISAIFSFV